MDPYLPQGGGGCGTSRSTVRRIVRQNRSVLKFRATGNTAPVINGFAELPMQVVALNDRNWVPGVPGGIIVPKAGVYHFDGTAFFTAPGVAATVLGFYYLNGVIQADPIVAKSVTAGQLVTLHVERTFSRLQQGDRVSVGVLTPTPMTYIGVFSVFDGEEVP